MMFDQLLLGFVGQNKSKFMNYCIFSVVFVNGKQHPAYSSTNEQ